MITIEGVGKRYRRVRWVLKEIDVGLPPGQITVITGENGSGKSTLLRIAAGCTRPTVGRVRGRPRTVGYVPEKFPQAVRLSTSAYLRHMAGVRGLSSADADAAHVVLDRLGFVGDRHDPMRTLSKGNVQKVALAQALQPACRLLVLDEPWAGLDAAARTVVGELIVERASAGTTVLVTDHTGAASLLPGAARLGLVAGRLISGQAVGPHSATVRLRCPDGVAEEVAALSGVRSMTQNGGLVVLAVDEEHTDALLAHALRLGCSVRSVGTGNDR